MRHAPGVFDPVTLRRQPELYEYPSGYHGRQYYLSGLKLGNHPIPSDMFAIDAGHTREKSKTENLRLDMWVFPFLNVYGLVGHTRGSSVSVSVDSDPSQFRGLDRVIAGAVHQLYQSGKLQDIDFTLDFKGTTGNRLYARRGYGNWFGLVDTNYTRTDFDILDGSISAVTVSPRVGYRFSFQGIDGPSHLSLWVGEHVSGRAAGV